MASGSGLLWESTPNILLSTDVDLEDRALFRDFVFRFFGLLFALFFLGWVLGSKTALDFSSYKSHTWQIRSDVAPGIIRIMSAGDLFTKVEMAHSSFGGIFLSKTSAIFEGEI